MNKGLFIFLLYSGIFNSFLLYSDSLKSIDLWDYEWIIKESTMKTGPGPNRFSDNAVAVNSKKMELELSLYRQKMKWFSGEIYSSGTFTYGDFSLEFSLPANWDSNLVFGFFFYNEKFPPFYNEIDFEISRWGSEEGDLFHFTVQPYETSGQTFSFTPAIDTRNYSITIKWRAESIIFSLFNKDDVLLNQWIYTGEFIPRETESRIHMNLWLFQGKAPTGDGSMKIQIHNFSYTFFSD